MPAMDDTEDLERRLRELLYVSDATILREAADALASARGRVAALEAALLRIRTACELDGADDSGSETVREILNIVVALGGPRDR